MRKNSTILSFVSIENDSPIYLPWCFKNIIDIAKAIEDYMLPTNSSISVYKIEHGFNTKGISEFTSFASNIFYKIRIFFVINLD